MKIILATDHAGFELKEKIKIYLKQLGYEVSDEGAFEYQADDDYPDFIRIAAKRVASDPDAKGIIFGGSGVGEAIVANRERGVRAVVYTGGPEEIVKLSRYHNNTNVLSFGARFVSEDRAKEITMIWLQADFSGEDRHLRRIYKIDEVIDEDSNTEIDLNNF
jgi:ribose 5-phosphate isomerase B